MHSESNYDSIQGQTGDERFEQYVQYEDADGTVICDRQNPAAWIKSSTLRPCRR